MKAYLHLPACWAGGRSVEVGFAAHLQFTHTLTLFPVKRLPIVSGDLPKDGLRICHRHSNFCRDWSDPS